MSVTNTLPVPVIQMGHVEKIVEVEQNHPLVQQLVAQEMTRSELKRQESQVPEVNKPEEGKKIRDREAGRKGGRQAPDGQKRQAADAEEPDLAAGETPGRGTNPWAGHIVNVKI